MDAQELRDLFGRDLIDEYLFLCHKQISGGSLSKDELINMIVISQNIKSVEASLQSIKEIKLS